jgi:Zn ribbon nucleic-acid-binding protein
VSNVIDYVKCPDCGQQAEIKIFGEHTKSAQRGKKVYYRNCNNCGANTRGHAQKSLQKQWQQKYNQPAPGKPEPKPEPEPGKADPKPDKDKKKSDDGWWF